MKINKFIKQKKFINDDFEREKYSTSLSKHEDELLNKLATFLVDMATAEIQNNKYK